jgi:hypothetical protein
MKRNAKIAAALAAGGVVVAGGVLVASPVFASDGAEAATLGRHGVQTQAAGEADCSGEGPGEKANGQHGEQMGEHKGEGTGGRMGGRMGGGDHTATSMTAQKGTLSTAQKATLTAMAEEEKLAHDLYTAFADRYDVQVFDRIVSSESRHLDAVRVLLDRYGLDDPTEGKAAGVFTDAKTKATYDQLLAQGNTGQQQALEAGRTVEKTDITDLTNALKGLDAPDAKQVYESLLDGSKNHLEAFERWLDA